MIYEEIFRLKAGIVVSGGFDKDKYYVIDKEDVFGNGDCVPDKMVFSD